jgi:hypothetical protein
MTMVTQNESRNQPRSRRAQVGRLRMTRMTMKTQLDPGLKSQRLNTKSANVLDLILDTGELDVTKVMLQ